jgi:LEA14-like dessication related protein
MKKVTLVGLILLFAVGSVGIYGILLYNAAQQLEIGEVDVMDIDVSLKSLSCELKVEISSPNGFPVNVDGGTFDIYINGTYVGPGEFGAFSARKEISTFPVFVTVPSSSIDLTLASILSGYLWLGRDIELKITIKTISIYGFEIELNVDQIIIL